MARMTSSRTNGKNCRYVTEFDRPVSSVSRGNVDGFRISLNLPSNADRYDDASKERDYSLMLDEADIALCVKNIFGDVGQSLTSELFGDRKHDRLGEPTLNKLGIYLQTYRMPAKGFSAFQTHYYVRAVNERHALEQLKRVLKGDAFQPNGLELMPEEGTE